MLSNFPKVTQLLSGRAGIPTQLFEVLCYTVIQVDMVIEMPMHSEVGKRKKYKIQKWMDSVST